ncbi:MAG: DUF192 domain-containing protein [Bacteriovoracaceae bacterium]
MGQYLKIRKNGNPLYNKVRHAKSFTERAFGLMFKESMEDMDALLIEPCRSIHTFFMKFDIDVVFLNRKNEVVKIIRNFRPWRATPIYFKSNKVLEFLGGTLNSEIEIGDELEIIYV